MRMSQQELSGSPASRPKSSLALKLGEGRERPVLAAAVNSPLWAATASGRDAPRSSSTRPTRAPPRRTARRPHSATSETRGANSSRSLREDIARSVCYEEARKTRGRARRGGSRRDAWLAHGRLVVEPPATGWRTPRDLRIENAANFGPTRSKSCERGLLQGMMSSLRASTARGGADDVDDAKSNFFAAARYG